MRDADKRQPVRHSQSACDNESGVKTCSLWRFRIADVERETDALAVEEPLQIFVQGKPFTITLRSPGQDVALAAGLLFTEGIVDRREDLAGIRQCREIDGNEVFAELSERRLEAVEPRLRQGLRVSRTSCGLCGRELVESAFVQTPPIDKPGRVSGELLQRCREQMEQAQTLFSQTGNTHAAALFASDGELIAIGEDVGRHNAMDKAIGAAFLAGSLSRVFLGFASSRASFEMVQKAARARVAVMGFTSGATSLAVDLAARTGMTLAAFVRPTRFAVYSCPERFAGEPLPADATPESEEDRRSCEMTTRNPKEG